MRGQKPRMPLLRLAYTTQFLIALIAVFFVWEEVGGPYHLELMPWWMKLVLGTSLAFSMVRATVGAVSHAKAWNKSTVKWCVAALALAAGCAIANYYCNLYGEEEDQQDEQNTSIAAARGGGATLGTHAKNRPDSAFVLRPAHVRVGTRRTRINRPHRPGAINA